MSSKVTDEGPRSRSKREKIKSKIRAFCSIKLLMIMGFALQAAIPILIIIIVTVSKQEQMIMSHSHDIANILRKRIHDNVDAYMNAVIREASQLWFQNQYAGFDPYDLTHAQKVMYPSMKYSNVTSVYYTRIDRDLIVEYIRNCDDPKCPIHFIYALDQNFYDQEVENHENGTVIPNFIPVVNNFQLSTEEWHVKALQLESGGFSEPYYVGNTMWSAEPAVWLSLFLPITSPSNRSQVIGIAGSDLTLKGVGLFLDSLRLSPHSAVYIVETDTGFMIAGSHEKENVYRIENGSLIRLRLRESNQPLIGYIGAMLELQYGTNFSNVKPQMFTVDNITTFVDPIQFNKMNLRWTVLAMVSVSDYMQPAKELQMVILIVDIAVLVAAVILGLCFAFVITNPLSNMTTRMRKNVFFNVSQYAPRTRYPRRRSLLYEVATLQCNFAKMENAVNGFMKYVPREIVLNFINHPTQQRFFQPGVDPADIAIMFTDIEEFTSISETLQPTVLITILTDYLEAVSSAIKNHGGTLDKYIGDAVMALFNCPMKLEDYITKSCYCAIAVRDETAKLNITNVAIGLPEFKTRIGVHAGTCLVGNIGSSYRLSYTAIGDAVNLASRIESLNKVYGTYLLISSDCYEVVKDKILCREIDKVAVKGRTQGVKIYEIINLREKATEQEVEFVNEYNAIMGLYFERQFAAALWEALKFMRKYPFDKAVTVLKERMSDMLQHPPEASWDGSTVMNEK